MARFRFTIRGLLIVVIFVAVAIAALRAADDLWASTLFSLTIGALLVATLLAVHRTTEKRAFWLGFALFGWVYLAACVIEPVEPLLLTTKGLAYLDSKVPGRGPLFRARFLSRSVTGSRQSDLSALAFLSEAGTLASPRWAVQLWDATTGKLIAGAGGTSENFMRIGHTLLALLIALLGGRISRALRAAGLRQ